MRAKNIQDSNVTIVWQCINAIYWFDVGYWLDEILLLLYDELDYLGTVTEKINDSRDNTHDYVLFRKQFCLKYLKYTFLLAADKLLVML